MTALPQLAELKRLQGEMKPVPWTVEFEETSDFTLVNGEAVEVDTVRAWLVGATRDPLDFGYSHDAAKIAALARPLLAEVIRMREALEELCDDLAEDGEKIGADQSEQAEFSAYGRIARKLTRILEGEE